MPLTVIAKRPNMKIGLLSPAAGSGAHRTKKAFTLIELLVVIAIIAILAAILFPVFAQAREKARQASCLSNTKQIGLGIYQYIQDYDETIPLGGWGIGPYGSRWFRDIYPYVKNLNVYVCPSSLNNDTTAMYFSPKMASFPQYPGDTNLYPQSGGGYAINANLVGYPYNKDIGPPANPPYDSKTLADIKNSSGTFLVCEASAFTNAILGNNDAATWIKYESRNSDWQVTPPTDFTGTTGSYTRYTLDNSNYLRRPAARHSGGLNVIYCDGHAKWSRIDQFLGPLTNTPPGWPYGDANNSWDDK